MINLAIRQPVTIIVAVVLVILAGVISLTRLPVQLTPNVDSTVITVTTFWEGASPEEIEQNVIDKQEERLLSVSNLEEMTSTSQQSVGKIRLQFATGTDRNASLREVSDKLREVPDYPDNVDEPVISDTDEDTKDYIAWLVFRSTDPDLDIDIMHDFVVDRVEPALERVPGVSDVQVFGGRERELQIRIDPILLAQYGITPTGFAEAIRDTNRNISAGSLANGKFDVRLRTIGQYENIDQILDTVVAQGKDGGKVLVRDVAEVVQTYKEPSSLVRRKGQPVLALAVDREVGSNVMAVVRKLRTAIDKLNADGGLLDAEAKKRHINGKFQLTQIYDQTVYIDDALSLVKNNIWLGGALATLVLLVSLRSIRSVTVVITAIPISVIGSVAFMVAMGRSMNVISLAGMAFAVGMVVDNAIVVLENIFRHVEMGETPREASLTGTKEIWGAVLASTLTTVVVFIPILLIQDEAGQLFRDISLAIVAAVSLSLIVSITVVPCFAARILTGKNIKPGEKPRRHLLSDLVSRIVYRLSGSTTARLLVIIILTGVSVLGTMKLMPPADYLPAGNRNMVMGLMLPPPGYNIDHMSELGARVEKTIRPYWEAGELTGAKNAYKKAWASLPSVPTFNWMTQKPGDPVVPPPLEDYFLVSFEGIMFQGGMSAEPTRVIDLMPLFSYAMRPEVLPGVIAFPFQIPLFQLGGSTGSAVKMQLVGDNLDDLVKAGNSLVGQLFSNPKFGQVQPQPSNFNISGPEVQVVPDLVRLSELGLTVTDLGLAVTANGDGVIIDEYHVGGEAIDLKIISKYSVNEKNPPDLASLPLATRAGEVVTLGSVARIRRIGSPQEIDRVSRQRAVTFQVSPAQGVSLEETVNELNRIVESSRLNGAIPPGISVRMAGSASKLAAVRRALLGDGTFIGTISSSLVLALLVVYLLMCVLFQSFVQPIVIMFSVPLAVLGGFAALFAVFIWSITDRYMPVQMLDVLTMLGFVILIGVVVNNAILIVHQSLNFLHGRSQIDSLAPGEVTPRRAISEAVRSRVRPIFMSTLTSVGGMLPLVLMPGAGSELYRGLGSVVVGGLMVSTVFTLFLVPMLLSFVLDFNAYFQAKHGNKSGESGKADVSVP